MTKFSRLSIAFFILAISGWLSLAFVKNQFGGYDLSPLIDLVWRFSNGEVPGTDFINTLPPIFLILSKFTAISPSWLSLTEANIIFTTIAFGLAAAGFKNREAWWWVLSGLIFCIPLVYTNHIWHSSISQLSAIAFYVHISNYLSDKNNRTHNFPLIFLASALVVLTKQNLGPPLFFCTAIFIFFYDKSEYRSKTIVIMFAGAAAGIASSFAYLGYSLNDFIYIYTSVLGRSKVSLIMYKGISKFASYYPIILLLIAFVFLIRKNIINQVTKFGQDGSGYDLVVLFISTIPLLTDWDAKVNNLPLPIFVFTNIAFLDCTNKINRAQDALKSKIGLASIFVFCAFGIATFGGFSRERMKHVGDFYDKSLAHSGSESAYFGEVIFGRKFNCTLQGIISTQSTLNLRKIYFGPRLEFGYQIIKQQSPHKLPLWIHPGTSYKFSDESFVVDTFVSHKFDAAIFLKDDRTRMPDEIKKYIENNFVKTQGPDCLDIFIRS